MVMNKLFKPLLLLAAIGLLTPAGAGVGQEPGPAPKNLPARILWKADHEMMMKVPAGAFSMGGGKEKNSQPRHVVTLPDYYMDRTEVTWRQFLNFCKQTERRPPTNYYFLKPFPPAMLEHPVNGVTWQDAHDYCQWAGKRLPTEAEWEKACAGPGGQTYAWGSGWDANACVNRVNSGDHTHAVASKGSCQSPYGIMDLGGNVWEWTDGWYQNYPGSSATWDHTGKNRVVRGGAYFYSIYLLQCSNRWPIFPDDASDHGGFRCVATPDASIKQKAEPK